MSARGFLLSSIFMVGLLFIYASLSTSSQSPSLVPFSAIITSPQTNLTFPARPAAFGPSLPLSTEDDFSDPDDTNGAPIAAFSGPLYLIESRGCMSRDSDSSELIPDLRNKIALVLRGECSFYEKVLNLQTWGASAVLVGDVDGTRGLLTMSAKGDTHRVRIPSFFVSHSAYEQLALLDSIAIIPSQPASPVLDTLLFLLVSPLLSLSLIYALLIFHRRYKRMRDRAPKAFVDSLPTRVWGVEANSTGPEKLWGSAAECVICLEDYVPGQSRVMQLPCGHEFHSSCITPWLTLRKRTCPICKRDVTNAAENVPLIISSSSESGDPDIEESRQQHQQHQSILDLHPDSDVEESSSRRQNLIEIHDDDIGDDLYDARTSVRMEPLTPTSVRPAFIEEPEASCSSSPSQSHIVNSS